MPSLTDVSLDDEWAFEAKTTVTTNCSSPSYLSSLGNIGALVDFFTDKCIVSECWSDSVPLNAEEIIIEDSKCNGENDRLDLSKYVNLKNVTIGEKCFKYQEVLNLTGLNTLERMVIGKNSFTKHRDEGAYEQTRHFYLKDCEQLKELKMGPYSFSDYAVCEIENVPSLEVIEMGELNALSSNFYYASLKLKSDGDGMR